MTTKREIKYGKSYRENYTRWVDKDNRGTSIGWSDNTSLKRWLIFEWLKKKRKKEKIQYLKDWSKRIQDRKYSYCKSSEIGKCSHKIVKKWKCYVARESWAIEKGWYNMRARKGEQELIHREYWGSLDFILSTMECNWRTVIRVVAWPELNV